MIIPRQLRKFVALLVTLAARAVAQGPQHNLEIRMDSGQAAWIAMAPDLLPAQAIPGVEGLLRIGGPAMSPAA